MIHTTALVDPGAHLAPGVHVGAYAVIGPDVVIGENTSIGPHAVVSGPTWLGRDNRVSAFCAVGGAPQDKKYGGEPTRLEIGDRNVIREYCSINRGTTQDRGVTRLGSDNWIMAYVHIAHDCQVGDHTVLANGASLAGHVRVEDHACLGGFALVHQFCRIGAHSFSAMGSAILKDVPPYVMVSGNPAQPRGLNGEGLRRRGTGSEPMSLLRQAYRIIYRQGLPLEQALKGLAVLAEQSQEVRGLRDFVRESQRGIVR